MCCLCFFRGATSASRLARVAVILATTLAYAVQFTATIVRRPKLPRACTRAGVDGRRRGTRVRSKPRLPTPSPPWPPRPTRPCPRRRRPTATPARGRGTSLVRRSWPPRPEERTPNARRPRSGSRGTPPRRATAGRAAARPPTRPTCAVPGRRSKFAKKIAEACRSTPRCAQKKMHLEGTTWFPPGDRRVRVRGMRRRDGPAVLQPRERRQQTDTRARGRRPDLGHRPSRIGQSRPDAAPHQIPAAGRGCGAGRDADRPRRSRGRDADSPRRSRKPPRRG
mmetsp:Transcript_2913/g.8645  ORF Transcript_2913/g.8645 Transcript_2913/m.8645 type:complete len:280 (-) Transcript_2913:29-868(-)